MKWISVEDDLPDINQPVFAIAKGYESELFVAMRIDAAEYIEKHSNRPTRARIEEERRMPLEGYFWTHLGGRNPDLLDRLSYELEEHLEYTRWMPLSVEWRIGRL